jgi:hypothetical protein
MELDPTGSPGDFTVIAELNGDITFPELSRGETEVTPHQDNIDSWVLGILRRGPLSFSVNWIFDDGTHDHLTGLLKSIKDNQVRGYRLRGPGGTDDTDEWLASGQVQAVTQTNPVREGARTSDVTVRLSGPMIVDGVPYGA